MASVSELHRAIQNKDTGRLKALVQAGTDVNEVHRQETAFTRAAEELVGQEGERCVEEILSCPGFDPNACNQFDQTPLHVAAKVGRVDWLDRLLDKGAAVDDIDIAGISPLSSCATPDSDACALKLILQGASVNLSSKDGVTPLHRACAKGATKVAHVLLRNGADVNAASDKGETPLMSAVSFYYHYTFANKNFTDLLDLCEALVCAGCDLNAFDSNGRTALHREVESNNIYGVCFLVQHGCDLDIENKAGLTPYQTATLPDSTKYELARYLLHYGATVEADLRGKLFQRSQQTCPINQVMQGISKFKLNDLAVTNRALLLRTLCEAVFPRNCPYRDDVHFPQRQSADRNTEAAASPISLQRLRETEEAVSLWANQSLGEPCSLQHQAKLRVRAALGSVDIIAKIGQLPIGATMKRYLNLGVPLELSSLYKEVRLHAAVISNNLVEVQRSIESGANIQATLDGDSALTIALRKGTDSIITELFRHIPSLPSTSSSSLTPSSPLPSSGFSDLSVQGLASTHFITFGETILHLVAKAGRTKYVGPALELCKGQLDARNLSGRTALEEAVCLGHFPTAENLLELGASMLPCPSPPGAPGEDQQQPGPSLLHLAAASGAKRVVELLLERGADVNATDKYGFTPLRLALGGVSCFMLTQFYTHILCVLVAISHKSIGLCVLVAESHKSTSVCVLVAISHKATSLCVLIAISHKSTSLCVLVAISHKSTSLCPC